MKRNLRFLAGAFLLTATALFTGQRKNLRDS